MSEDAPLSPKLFALVIGASRSGTTITGAILDAHPQILCANESSASNRYWAGISRDELIAEIVENSAAYRAAQRPSSGYLYGIEAPAKDLAQAEVLADKVWNALLLLMHGTRTLLSDLSATMACPLALIHCVRNPFDVIATMSARSGATLRDRMRWYFMYCEAATAVAERGGVPIHLVRHERLIADPAGTSTALYGFLGKGAEAALLANIAARVFTAPRRTRLEADWPAGLVKEIETRIAAYDFLAGYGFDSE